MSLNSIYSLDAIEHDRSPNLRRRGNTFAVALMVTTSAVATFDLYLFAATAIHRRGKPAGTHQPPTLGLR